MRGAGPEDVVFHGKILEVVRIDIELPSGIKTFEFARRAPGTRILVLNDENQILLTREYRHELNGIDVRVPGGKVFDTMEDYHEAIDAGRSLPDCAADAAARELLEESGYVAKGLEPLGTSRCGATVEWDLYYFLCSSWKPPSTDFASDPDEQITSFWCDLTEARALCLNGRISEERTALRIVRLAERWMK